MEHEKSRKIYYSMLSSKPVSLLSVGKVQFPLNLSLAYSKCKISGADVYVPMSFPCFFSVSENGGEGHRGYLDQLVTIFMMLFHYALKFFNFNRFLLVFKRY